MRSASLALQPKAQRMSANVSWQIAIGLMGALSSEMRLISASVTPSIKIMAAPSVRNLRRASASPAAKSLQAGVYAGVQGGAASWRLNDELTMQAIAQRHAA